MPALSLWFRDRPFFRDEILAQHDPDDPRVCPVCQAKAGELPAEECRWLRAAREAAVEHVLGGGGES